MKTRIALALAAILAAVTMGLFVPSPANAATSSGCITIHHDLRVDETICMTIGYSHPTASTTRLYWVEMSCSPGANFNDPALIGYNFDVMTPGGAVVWSPLNGDNVGNCDRVFDMSDRTVSASYLHGRYYGKASLALWTDTSFTVHAYTG